MKEKDDAPAKRPGVQERQAGPPAGAAVEDEGNTGIVIVIVIVTIAAA